MPTHHLAVWTTLTVLLTRSLIRVLFIILPSASEKRRKAKRKRGIKEEKKKSCLWSHLPVAFLVCFCSMQFGV